jgi:Ankyrin repeats (many copies)
MLCELMAGSQASHQRADQDSSASDSVKAVLVQQALAVKFLNRLQARGHLIDVAERLVQLGASVSAVDSEGRTALHLAASCGDGAMVLRLVELGADVNCKDFVGGTLGLALCGICFSATEM